MAVDRLDPVGVYFGTSTGQVYGSADEGVTWTRLADNLPPIWSVEAHVVGLRPAPPAIVHLPRSLVALFPGAERRAEARGGTVLEVVTDLDRARAGAREPHPGCRAGRSGPTSTCSWTANGRRSRPRCRPAPRFT